MSTALATVDNTGGWLSLAEAPGALAVPADLVAPILAANVEGQLAVSGCAGLTQWALNCAEGATEPLRERLFALDDAPALTAWEQAGVGNLSAAFERQEARFTARKEISNSILAGELNVLAAAFGALPRSVHKDQLARARAAARETERDFTEANQKLAAAARTVPSEAFRFGAGRAADDVVRECHDALEAACGIRPDDVAKLRTTLNDRTALASDLAEAWHARLDRECIERRKLVDVPTRLCRYCAAPLQVDAADLGSEPPECGSCAKARFARDLAWGLNCAWCGRWFDAPDYPAALAEDCYSVFCSPPCAYVCSIDVEDFGRAGMLRSWPLIHLRPPYPRTLREKREAGVDTIEIRWDRMTPTDPAPRYIVLSDLPSWASRVLPPHGLTRAVLSSPSSPAVQSARAALPVHGGGDGDALAREAILATVAQAPSPLTRDQLAATVALTARRLDLALPKLVKAGEIRRDGTGTKGAPFRYSLPSALQEATEN